MAFQKATKKQAKFRGAITGPAGAGKTITALRMAKVFGSPVALIDTEHGSASKYADQFTFDTMELTEFHPQKYIDAIGEAASAGYPVLIIDSLSHAWAGKDGALEIVNKQTQVHKGNSYVAWGDVTPIQNKLIEAILSYPGHVIVTMRSKMDYLQVEENGRKQILKVGMAPVQRDGMEYEFDVVIDMDIKHLGSITKTRCSSLDGAAIEKPGEDLAQTILSWLTDGEEDSDAPMRAEIDRLCADLNYTPSAKKLLIDRANGDLEKVASYLREQKTKSA